MHLPKLACTFVFPLAFLLTRVVRIANQSLTASLNEKVLQSKQLEQYLYALPDTNSDGLITRFEVRVLQVLLFVDGRTNRNNN